MKRPRREGARKTGEMRITEAGRELVKSPEFARAVLAAIDSMPPDRGSRYLTMIVAWAATGHDTEAMLTEAELDAESLKVARFYDTDENVKELRGLVSACFENMSREARRPPAPREQAYLGLDAVRRLRAAGWRG